VDALAVRVASQLAEVREPRVRPLDGPAQSHRLVRRRLGRPSSALPRDDGVVELALGEALSGGARVVAAIEPDGLDVAEQPALRGGIQCRREEEPSRLRFAPSIAQPIGMPARSVRIDHFQPSLPRSVGFLPVPSPPQGLCATTRRLRRRRDRARSPGHRRSSPPAPIASNTPATSHSSRRWRTVVSDTLFPQRRSASSHEQPVESRTSITSKQSRFEERGRWQPSGCTSTRTGTSGSMAAHTASNGQGRRRG